ncbi:MAG: alpha/beta fold hydrolase [Opitutaceae bacterium]|nr:alpha/beta fold hydrolase [Opitutaceae bacterium]
MHLYHRDLGGSGNPPLIILHGFLGSSRNWQTVGRDLSQWFHVYALDLRNHGQSPWADTQDYAVMAADILTWMSENELSSAHFIGHSMGGKLAMYLACYHPEVLQRLVVVDIAPKKYPPAHTVDFNAMHSVALENTSSRSAAEKQMEEWIEDDLLRQFLLTNLGRGEEGKLKWIVNLSVLEKYSSILEQSPLKAADRYDGEVLLLIGGKSSYFAEGDEAIVTRHFPSAEIHQIEESGHNPHFDTRNEFVSKVQSFLLSD